MPHNILFFQVTLKYRENYHYFACNSANALIRHKRLETPHQTGIKPLRIYICVNVGEDTHESRPSAPTSGPFQQVGGNSRSLRGHVVENVRGERQVIYISINFQMYPQSQVK